MSQNKKLLLIGPSGVGKTTIKNIFFDKVNPTQLLEFPLEPSRGINSEVYSFQNTHLGIFDLAGQENNTWFSKKGNEIFQQSNAIICIFDIKNSLESIIEFMIKLHKLREELNLSQCYFASFLHKTDRVNPTYVEQKIRRLQEFFSTQKILGDDIQIFGTSITENYFYQTFYTISEIINRLYDENNMFDLDSNELKNMKIEISLIQEINASKKYFTTEFAQEKDIKIELMREHLRRLEKFGLVKNTDNFDSFQLTERATYIKVGWEREKAKNDNDLSRNVEMFRLLLILNYNTNI
jgi:GTPase SAR1 family protein